jgi:hypothetical protein
MSRKVFTAGEVLAAADVNSFLMDQTVMSFAGTAARGSAIPSPTLGMYTHLEDAPARTQFWNGSAWVTPMGLTLINDTTFSSSTLVRVNSVFSAAYDNYLIKLDYKTSATGGAVVNMRYLTAVDTPTATSLYDRVGLTSELGSLANYAGNNETDVLVGVSGNVNGASSTLEVHRPFLSARTVSFGSSMRNDGAVLYSTNYTYRADTSFNGFQLTPNTGNITGTVKTYGYRNS